MKNVQNKKVVVITGASGGLGKALAAEFAQKDNILVLCAKDINELNSVCSELKNKNAKCYPFKVDVSKRIEIEKFITTVVKKFSRIDVLINNAGAIHKPKPIDKITDKEYELCLRTNLDSVFYAIRKVIPSMKKNKSGTIITIASTAGKRGNPDFAAYSASKFAVIGLMQSVARYLGQFGIRCLTISPAGMNTQMRSYILGKDDAKKQQSPQSVARLIKGALEDNLKYPNGSEIEIRDGKISNVYLIN